MEFSKIEFKQHSHVSYKSSYLTTEKSDIKINGENLYKHIDVRRNKFGEPVGKGKVCYSIGINGKAITEEQANRNLAAFEIKSSGVLYKPNGCKMTLGTYCQGCGNCGKGNNIDCKLI